MGLLLSDIFITYVNQKFFDIETDVIQMFKVEETWWNTLENNMHGLLALHLHWQKRYSQKSGVTICKQRKKNWGDHNHF